MRLCSTPDARKLPGDALEQGNEFRGYLLLEPIHKVFAVLHTNRINMINMLSIRVLRGGITPSMLANPLSYFRAASRRVIPGGKMF
jgi:hypothetical protein